PACLPQQLQRLFLLHVSQLQASSRHTNNRPITRGQQHLESQRNKHVHDLAFPHIVQHHKAWGGAGGCNCSQMLLHLLEAIKDVRHPVRSIRRRRAHLPGE
ncbi:unnamed protein product, partial [Ectocarpus sp. 8 AP-2014]